MASQNSATQPTAGKFHSSDLNSYSLRHHSELRHSKFSLGIALLLHRWHALTVAVDNEWGGPDSSDKRDNLAAQLVDILEETPDVDSEDLQDVLLDAMEDFYNVNLEDGSEKLVAEWMLRMKSDVLGKGEFGSVDRMWENFKEKDKFGGKGKQKVKVEEAEDDGDSVDDESGDEDEDEMEDVEMEDAPALVGKSKIKPQPEVDDDGFTTVSWRKR
jgi:pre-rRNA-processing protein TSR2